MIGRALVVVTATLVASGCSPSGGPSIAEPTTTTTITTATMTTTANPPVGGEQQLCADLASIDLSNPQHLLTIQLPRTTDSTFDVPLAYLAARLTALESALNAGTDPAYPAQDVANAATSVLDACRQGGYL
jgi:outer membrane murein-binding lipoprotein Lpp